MSLSNFHDIISRKQASLLSSDPIHAYIARSDVNVYVCSDLHTDFQQNYNEITSLLSKNYENISSRTKRYHNVIIIAGDISHQLDIIKKTLILFKEYFHSVFYTFGNHDLWCAKDAKNGLEKYFQIENLCEKLSVYTKPTHLVNSLFIFPLLSWHSPSFDNKPRSLTYLEEGFDSACNWPSSLLRSQETLSQFWLSLNEPAIEKYSQIYQIYQNSKSMDNKDEYKHNNMPIINQNISQVPKKITERMTLEEMLDSLDNITPLKSEPQVISFSHFCPRYELYSWGRPDISKVIGCLGIDNQIRRLKSHHHIFGHTHMNTNHNIDGVNYIQNSLGTSKIDHQHPELFMNSVFSFLKINLEK